MRLSRISKLEIVMRAMVVRLCRNGELQLIAGPGTEAPGTNDVCMGSSFGGISVNNSGQIALTATIDFSERGIWIVDPSGAFSLVVIEGQEFVVDDDPAVEDLRTIETLTVDFDQNSSFLNESGQLQFVANFDDGTSGLFRLLMSSDEFVFQTISLSDERSFEQSIDHFGFIFDFSDSIPPVINNVGDAVFNSFERNGLIRSKDSELELIALQYHIVPGVP